MITDHAYDSGPINTGAPCIADCGQFEHEHRYSEYVDGAPGSMHEPHEYQGELDWPEDVLDPNA